MLDHESIITTGPSNLNVKTAKAGCSHYIHEYLTWSGSENDRRPGGLE